MGSLHDSMMAIINGEVKISMASPDGKEVVLAILRAGEVFGEIAMLDGKPRSADVEALTECSLAVLGRRDVLAALGGNQAAWLGLIEVLCSRLRQTDDHLVEVALLGLPVRLAKVLLRMIDERGNRAKIAAAADIRRSQSELANMVGAARENVNKCLQEWQRAGIIRMENLAERREGRYRLSELIRDPQAVPAENEPAWPAGQSKERLGQSRKAHARAGRCYSRSTAQIRLSFVGKFVGRPSTLLLSRCNTTNFSFRAYPLGSTIQND